MLYWRIKGTRKEREKVGGVVESVKSWRRDFWVIILKFQILNMGFSIVLYKPKLYFFPPGDFINFLTNFNQF